MDDKLYVYCDKGGDIVEITTELRGDLVCYDIEIVDKSASPKLLELYNEWCNEFVVRQRHALINDDGVYYLNKIIYIYYHYKDFTIKCLAPKHMKEFDNDDTLIRGVAVINDVITNILNGDDSQINYQVEKIYDHVELKKIPTFDPNSTFLDAIENVTDYKLVGDSVLAPAMDINHDRAKSKLHIKLHKIVEDGLITLYFVNKFDNTHLFGHKKIKTIDTDIYVDIDEYPNDVTIFSPHARVITYNDGCNVND